MPCLRRQGPAFIRQIVFILHSVPILFRFLNRVSIKVIGMDFILIHFEFSSLKTDTQTLFWALHALAGFLL